jgi:hypothetical protein
MSDVERDTAIAVLQSYSNKFTTILDMIGASNGLTGNAKHEAQELLRELKESLKVDCKLLDQSKGKLNKYDDCFVEPALRKCKANIQSPWNAVPNQKVHSDLYGARIDITHALHQLKNLPADWSPAG